MNEMIDMKFATYNKDDLPSIFFVIPDPAGDEITHQTGGICCTQSTVIGRIVRLTEYDRCLSPWDQLIPTFNYGMEEGHIIIGGLTFNGTMNRDKWMGKEKYPALEPLPDNYTDEQLMEWSEKYHAVEGGYIGKQVSLIEYCWLRIKANTGWDWEEVDPPEGQMWNTEGFEWVRITEVPPTHEKTGRENPAYPGRGIPEYVDTKKNEYLLGQVVCLIYPNCD